MTTAQRIMKQSQANAFGMAVLGSLACKESNVFVDYDKETNSTVYLFSDDSALIANIYGLLVLWSVH